MEFLSMDNILTEEEASTLFDDFSEVEKEQKEEKEETQDNDTTEVTPDELFEEEPESVGSEENSEEKEDTTSKKDGSSPKNNFYSSIASALKEEGIFPDLDDSLIDEVKEPEDFRDLVDKQIQAGLEEAQKRIYDALNAGVEPSVIKQYENTIGFLNNISEAQITDESDKGEMLRKQLLQQDFLNRGYSQERAVKMTEKLFASGEDIEEARQALQSNKEFYGGKYQQLLDDAKREEEENKRAARKQAEDLKKDILNNSKVFGDVEIDKSTRQKIYDNISKPVYRDPETGDYYTTVQKYRLEHENDFIKNVGILFTLTDGFSNLEKLIKPSAKKEVKKKLKELEHTINNTSRNNNGTLKYVGSSSSEDKQFLDGFSIDIN